MLGGHLGQVLRWLLLDDGPHPGRVDVLLRLELVEGGGLVGGVADLTHLAPLIPLRHVVPVLLDLGGALGLDNRDHLRGELLLLFQAAVVLIEIVVPPLDVVAVLPDRLDDLVQLVLRFVVDVVPFVHFDRAQHLVVVLLCKRDLVVGKYARTLQRKVFRS